MAWFDGVAHRLRTVLDPGAHERELREEMEFHERLDAGQRDESAARRRFGNRTYYQEETRRMTWLGFLDVAAQDLRYAWRSMRRAPGFTFAVVTTLALGIGVNAAMFTFLDRVFVRPPAGVNEPETVRRLWITRFRNGVPTATTQGLSFPHYASIRDELKGVAEVAYYNTDNAMALGRDYAGPPVHGVWATANYFPLLGVRPALGRLFGPDEDDFAAPSNVAVVSHAFWQTRLRGDTGILGRPLAIGRTAYTVVGILEPEFQGLDVQAADIWFPAAAFPGRSSDQKPLWQSFTTWGARTVLRVEGNVADVELAARATAAIRRAEQGLTARRRDTLQRAQTGPIVEARGPGTPDRQIAVASRLGAVAAVVLLVACANVVNLLLARAVYRRREIAVRLALGVSRSRLFRMVTTETMLMAIVAGAAALLVAWWGGTLLRTLILPGIEWTDAALDQRVVVFTVLVALGAGLLAGIVPAIQSGNPRLTETLKSGGAASGESRSLLRSGLVVSQTAMSLVLIVVAALFVRSLGAVRGIDLGYDAERVLYSYLYFEEGEEPLPAVRSEKIARVAREFVGHPGVEGIAIASSAPMRGYSFTSFFTERDSMGTLGESAPAIQYVTPGFFETTGLRVVRGRAFAGPELGGPSSEIVVNQQAARVLWPGEEPLGKCVRLGKRDAPCSIVVGVSETSRRFGVMDNQMAQFLAPLGGSASEPAAGSDVVLRVAPGARASVSAALDAALRREFPLARSTSKSMTEVLDPQYQPWRMAAVLFTGFGVLALVVALFGIYSAVAYSVGQRTREFGVRIAMGARLRDVVNQVLAEGLRVVLLGVVIGVGLSLAAGRIVASMLFGVAPADPSAMLLAGCTMLLVAGIAALVPGLRAARVNPVVALRSE